MTATDDEIVTFVRDFCGRHGFGPTIREVGEALGYRSYTAVKYRLDNLREEGRVTWQDGRTRTLRVAREVTA